MAVTCSIPKCQNGSPNQMFEFPKDESNRYVWLISIKESNPSFVQTNNCTKYVCSKHFKDQDFKFPDKQSLKDSAIPSVFDNKSYTYVDIYGLFEVFRNNSTSYGNSAAVDNKVNTNAVKSVKVISPPKPSYNKMKTSPSTRNVRHHNPIVKDVQLQEPLKQTATASSARSLRIRKRRRECSYCYGEDSESY